MCVRVRVRAYVCAHVNNLCLCAHKKGMDRQTERKAYMQVVLERVVFINSVNGKAVHKTSKRCQLQPKRLVQQRMHYNVDTLCSPFNCSAFAAFAQQL